ncbi:MAG: methyltransferase domain-containing protein [Rhodospirillaceae bacterium]|jgi:SAM-dependent methyltransferase|nr:methyltransferase domain-containing protein [Rhodospirillaceae bacterium]
MWRDVIDIRDFYGSSLGRQCRRMINARLRQMWPDAKGQSVLGLGYAVPYLGDYKESAARVIAAMPAQQGVLHWPADGPGQTTLVDELALPFEDLSMDRVIVVHALEYSEQVRPLLREVWRVLAGSGRLIVIVPNRRGLWARFERTPLGYGLPYSRQQLSHTLRENMFTPAETTRALFLPPLRSRMVQSMAGALETIGSRYFPMLGGVIIAEATKQIYAGTAAGAKAQVRGYVTMPNQTHRQTHRQTHQQTRRDTHQIMSNNKRGLL